MYGDTAVGKYGRKPTVRDVARVSATIILIILCSYLESFTHTLVQVILEQIKYAANLFLHTRKCQTDNIILLFSIFSRFRDDFILKKKLGSFQLIVF